jgi:hypothetical protein
LALRAAAREAFAERVDRLGAKRVVEVYPGAALSLWRFEHRG